MKGSLAVLGLIGAVMANPMPQVTSAIAPSSAAPSGCSTSHSGTFALTVVNVTSSSKRDLESRQSTASTLTLTLANGILKDSQGRTGYIAANQQFQFDSPPQTGAIYTAGWSVCGNNSLALGGSAIFYQCLSGTFYNLYAKSQGNQCAAVYFETSAIGASSSAAASQITDGQPQATTATSAKVSQITDGQPQATTATSAKVSQISDGQPQATTATSAKVSQISDGQPQASTAAATSAKVSQISDGQPQATTAAATSAKVSQISDGQPQATTGTSAKVSQISDGQPQATTGTSAKASSVAATSAKVSQISDGQPQATTAAVATFTGAADRNMAGRYAFAAGIVGAVALL